MKRDGVDGTTEQAWLETAGKRQRDGRLRGGVTKNPKGERGRLGVCRD